MAGIVGSELGVHAGDRWLFRALDLSLPAGECLVLTGANGSGKSTLLRCLYGAQRPAAGAIEVAGHVPDERDVTFRRKVSVLLDDSDFFAELSPRQHVELLLASFYRSGEQGPDTGALLAAASLGDCADVHAYHLSAGQRRRLLLLGATARPHEVLLLDEPERALDTQGMEWLAGEMRAGLARGRAIVLATHHAPLIGLADRIVDLG